MIATEPKEKPKAILIYCKWCNRIWRQCPECGVYETLQPESDAVADKCGGWREFVCDGCEAYRSHQ